mmetsp:Transcript_38467/g.106161  ORF Transcript_38467/g.106161 Transcript_38467/m.106161 type:complete len:223 (+) Transcript_38467:2381-3049(+)
MAAPARALPAPCGSPPSIAPQPVAASAPRASSVRRVSRPSLARVANRCRPRVLRAARRVFRAPWDTMARTRARSGACLAGLGRSLLTLLRLHASHASRAATARATAVRGWTGSRVRQVGTVQRTARPTTRRASLAQWANTASSRASRMRVRVRGALQVATPRSPGWPLVSHARRGRISRLRVRRAAFLAPRAASVRAAPSTRCHVPLGRGPIGRTSLRETNA